jgi:hypothetical protein
VRLSRTSEPLAIAMWDFSWLERRWPGAGYEDWDEALSGLAERGYNAVRIDAYPHLVAADPHKVWRILPVWSQMDWGAPAVIDVQVLPALIEFIATAQRHGIWVGLSTWYREDQDNLRMGIRSADDQGNIWTATLRHVADAGLLDRLLYVDLCNEFPIPIWTPYLYGGTTGNERRRSEHSMAEWMRHSIGLVKAEYPGLDCTFSFANQYRDWRDQDVAMLDFLEPHVWMAARETSDYYDRVDYNHEMFEPRGFNNLVARGETEYLSRKPHYDRRLMDEIDNVAAWSRQSGKALVTTECWALIDYKDWPGLDWGWIKDLTALGVEHAAATGRWTAMATSNFCGPQFHGMWRDVAWHRGLTDLIKSSPIDAELRA